MAGIMRRNISQPDDTFLYGEHGETAGVAIGNTDLWRSTLLPGRSWDGDHLFIEPGQRAWAIGEEHYELIDW